MSMHSTKVKFAELNITNKLKAFNIVTTSTQVKNLQFAEF